MPPVTRTSNKSTGYQKKPSAKRPSAKRPSAKKTSCLAALVPTKFFHSSSASSSEIWSCEVRGTPVIAKWFIVPIKGRYTFEASEGLQYEQHVYTHIQERMDDRNPDGSRRARNFVRLFGTFDYVSFPELVAFARKSKEGKKNKEFDTLLRRNILWNLCGLENRPGLLDNTKTLPPSTQRKCLSASQLASRFDLHHGADPGELVREMMFSVTITESVSPHVNLRDFIDDGSIREDDKRQVLFQTLFALVTLHRHFGVCHFDLIWTNVLVQPLSSRTQYIYQMGDFATIIDTPYKVFLFDYDNSYIRGRPNPWLVGNSYRQNEWNPLLDYLMFIKEMQKSSTFGELARRFVLKDLHKDLFDDKKGLERELKVNEAQKLKPFSTDWFVTLLGDAFVAVEPTQKTWFLETRPERYIKL